MRSKLLVFFFLLASPSFFERGYFTQKNAIKAGFEKECIDVKPFQLMTFHRLKNSRSIRIYIEGDGRAWENKCTLSFDPTPSNPIALGLAVCDHAESVAYIARPGQFGCFSDRCYWSHLRFAPEIVDAIDHVIDILKKRCSAKDIELVGYSGGGALAVLVAAHRSDVISLRTVAGNLDPDRFCNYHQVSPLIGSLNPMDVAQKIASIPQRHFIGSEDRIVPSFIARSFIEKEGIDDCLTVVTKATHQDPWCDCWEELLSYPLSQSSNP